MNPMGVFFIILGALMIIVGVTGSQGNVLASLKKL
jgi:hypothetical protein